MKTEHAKRTIKQNYWCYLPGEPIKICPICNNEIVDCEIAIDAKGVVYHAKCLKNGEKMNGQEIVREIAKKYGIPEKEDGDEDGKTKESESQRPDKRCG